MPDKKEEKLKERVSIFIDGSNLYHNLRRNHIKISFEELIKRLETKREVTDVFYYTAELDPKFNPQKYKDHHEFLERIRKIPRFHVVLCNLKKIPLEDGTFNYDIKGDDVHLTVDLISGAYEDIFDTAIIVSGDEDFIPALKKVQELGKKVENAYFIASASSALKNSSNASICMNQIIKEII